MRVVFLGSPEFAVPSLLALLERHQVVAVVSQPDKPAGRGQKMLAPPVKVAAVAAGIPVLQPASARSGVLRDALAPLAPDVAVVVAYGKILPKDVLELPRLGCLNVHSSLLPRHRGAAPINWAILDGDSVSGVSIMRLDEGMDTGPVFATRQVPIAATQTAGELHDALAPLGAALLMDVLDRLAKGNDTPAPQDQAGATHARKLSKEDGLVDFSQSAAQVSCRIRGVDPWPGAFATWADAPLKMWGAQVVPGAGTPGQVLLAGPSGLIVACGDGAVCVGELQLPGRKRMRAEEVCRGARLERGAKLGSRTP